MIFNVFFLCFSIYLIVQGIYLLATGKYFGTKENEKRKLYEEKAYNKFIKLSGWMYILAGVCAGTHIALRVFLPQAKYFSSIALILVLVMLIVMMIASKRLPKKSDVNVLNGKVSDDQYIDED